MDARAMERWRGRHRDRSGVGGCGRRGSGRSAVIGRRRGGRRVSVAQHGVARLCTRRETYATRQGDSDSLALGWFACGVVIRAFYVDDHAVRYHTACWAARCAVLRPTDSGGPVSDRDGPDDQDVRFADGII